MHACPGKDRSSIRFEALSSTFTNSVLPGPTFAFATTNVNGLVPSSSHWTLLIATCPSSTAKSVKSASSLKKPGSPNRANSFPMSICMTTCCSCSISSSSISGVSCAWIAGLPDKATPSRSAAMPAAIASNAIFIVWDEQARTKRLVDSTVITDYRYQLQLLPVLLLSGFS